MIKRYSFPTEQVAKDLIALLSDEPNPIVTETTSAIAYLGFQDKYNEEGELIEEGITYNVDVMWKKEAINAWLQYEVTPNTPNHKFI